LRSIFVATAAVAALLVALPATAAPAKAANLPAVEIPNTKFVLKNGLTLIVHEDHKAPIVAVNLWYHVGSKNEPAGRTGFAHLFEHLMFGGKNGNQKGWFEKMEAVGATDLNGTTYYDRTNFFENVPTAALDMTLFMESQRMGHLLDGFDEKLLTTQRGVVQNEKRQGDNQPYRISDDIITQSVWPASHPYSHTVIGEMADLDAATVANVKDWFSKFYGPSNATIVLAGDITPAEAKAKVERYFGDIPPGPPVVRQKVWIAKRTGEQRAVAQDRVPQARFYKVWNVPGDGAADATYLELLSDVLDAGKDSRLYKRLVYHDQIATGVSAGVDAREIAGLFTVTIAAKPGVDLAVIEAAFNEEFSRLLKDGPTAEEVDRVKTRRIGILLRGIERVGGFGGKSDTLAASQTFLDSPDAWKTEADLIRNATAGDLTKAGQRWLTDGAFVLDIVPFPSYAASTTGLDRTTTPVPGAMKAPGFVNFQRATLSNGLKVVLAERHDIQLVQLQLLLDAGTASDQFAKPGTASLTSTLLSDGTAGLDALQFSDKLLDQGASFGAGTAADYTVVQLNALSTRLDPSLDLFADAILHPGFRESDVEREKKLRIAAIQQAKQSPVSEALRIAPVFVYGPGHAYGVLSTEATVAALTRDDLIRYHQTWFRPNGATIVVVGDTTLSAIMPKLEARFGGWKAGVQPVKSIGPVALASTPVVYLIDKPGASQTVLTASLPAPPRKDPDDIAIDAMNTVLGGAFTSRLNMNLREDKHWSYGAQSFVQKQRGPSLFTAFAPVQTDKTKESFLEMRQELSEILTERPITAQDLTLAQNNLTLSLPGRWETGAAVAGSIGDIVTYGLPDDYYGTFAKRVSALTTGDVARAASAVIKPGSLTWVVIGDRVKIENDLRSTGAVVKVIDADGNSTP
jgi:zinc protease